MTVGELVEKLIGFNKDKEVVFAHPSGDHWRTVIAKEVEKVDELYLNYSEYHRKFVLLEVNEEKDESGILAVVLQ